MFWFGKYCILHGSVLSTHFLCFTGEFMAKAWPKSHAENPNLSAPPDLVMGLVFQQMCRRHAESIFGVTGKKGVLKSQESRAFFLSDLSTLF